MKKKKKVVEEEIFDEVESTEVSDVETDVEVDPDMLVELEEIEIETEEPSEDIDESASKHKGFKKHSLKYDSIFKGKKTDEEEEAPVSYNDKIAIDPGTEFWQESFENDDYHRLKGLREKVYKILVEHTDLNFKKNRRKPGPVDFNSYYNVVKQHIDDKAFSCSEIFVELAYYFSDNLFNMFKLLDKRSGAEIIRELKASKRINSKLDDIDFI